MVNDPQILFNDGFYPLLHVVLPEGSLLKPRFPAALGCRTHGLARQFDVLGGEPGERSEKILVRVDGTEERLPSKCDNVEVQPGDMLVYRTAGGGGWKDRLERPVEAVARDVSFGLVSREKALASYGVVIGADGLADIEKTEKERGRQRSERGEPLAFDFGPPLDQVLARCKEETGLEPPKPATPLRWSPLEDGAEVLARVREREGV